MSGLVHLHRHSEFSLLDGVGTADIYAKRAAELGQSALAITDHGSLAGVLYHAQACEEHDVKPIMGMEAYFTQDATKHDKDHKRFHLVLLAKNSEGFKNLMRLSSLSYTPENFYYKPCLDWRLIRQYSEGLIASTSCMSGMIPRAILVGDDEGAQTYLNTMQDIFGDDFYLEIQPHDDPGQIRVNSYLKKVAQEKGIPLVATSDVHFPHLEWANTQDILVMISTGQSNKSRADREALDQEIFKFSGNTYWLMSENELKKHFKSFHQTLTEDEISEAISNTQMIADRCEDFAIDRSPKVPKATKSLLEAERIIREWCQEGLERIGKENDEQYTQRMEDELDVMRKLKVFDYFVIVGDMVRWAKDQGIRVGPGRGSAVGSLVNYLIRITAVDPIGYGLLFERFLNEHRTSLPDIDVDFQSDKRDLVKQYLHDKWGEDYVVNISAFQSFDFRGAIKDVSRVLNVPFGEVERATKRIPKKTWEETWESLEGSIKELKEFFEKYPKVKTHAYRLHGQVKGQSEHAGAVIITNKPALDIIPMMRSKGGGMVTQWSERANAQLISPYGFLKIDCLATDSLTTQAETIKRIKENTGREIDLDNQEEFKFLVSPYESDSKVIDIFYSGHNLGIFQFGGSNDIIALLKKIKPENLEHIIAGNALNRPGTLANGVAFEYARRKNGDTFWKIPHESLREYLDTTYGFMIFQEQVMQVFRALAKDASGADADVFLKVVAKGIARDLEGKQKMQKYYDQFVAGCIEKEIDQRTYDEIWSQILEMSTYSFNKSHSSGYGVQAYQDAWLKAYYPLEFYASLLSSKMKASADPQKKVTQVIKEANVVGIKILPPDINTSDIAFTIDGNSIRFGLQAIKFVGSAAIEEIEKNRPFESYEDFCERVQAKKANSRVKKALVAAGAFDSLGGRSELTEEEKSIAEKEFIGFALSTTGSEKFDNLISETVSSYNGSGQMLGGEITNIKEINTKKGDKMAFVGVDFGTENYSLTFFPEHYARFHHILSEGNHILALGEYDEERETTVVNNAISASQLELEIKNAR